MSFKLYILLKYISKHLVLTFKMSRNSPSGPFVLLAAEFIAPNGPSVVAVDWLLSEWFFMRHTFTNRLLFTASTSNDFVCSKRC